MGKFHSYSEKRGVKWGVFWWTVAAVLHATAVGCLIYFSPLRQWFLSREDATEAFAKVEGYRVHEIAQSLIDINALRLREKIGEQKAALVELARICDKRHARYVRTAEQARDRDAGAPAPERLAALGPPGPDPDIALRGKTIVELYNAAQAIEKTTYGTYRQMRAVELARIQGLPLTEAFDATQVAVPDHPAIDERALDEVILRVDDGKFQALKDELAKIRAEVGSMLASALRMLDMAYGIMGADVGGITVFGAGGTFEGSGDIRWGSAIGPSLAPHEYYPGARDSDFDEATFRPVPGRTLTEDGEQADWMYLDTWYVIGPFPNPSREYMDRKFPPESVIDLDATYVGKQGLRLQWQFMQSPTMMIAPHMATNYAIWYAFTEVWAERDQDRWVAFGSDDYSKCWLNGKLVWTSGKTPHHWIPDRGFRKLHFKQGYNSVLVKLENAGGTTGFSVILYLGDVTMPGGK